MDNNKGGNFKSANTSSYFPNTRSLGGDGYLIDSTTTPQIESAPGSFQTDGFLADAGVESSGSDAESGFLRPSFPQSTLSETAQLYDRHVFLCYKNPQVWPSHIEAAMFDRLPRLLSAALMARKCEMTKQTCLMICEGHDGTETSNGDVLIFPDMIRYRRLTHFDVDTFVEEVLVKDGEWLPGNPELLKCSYVFVCSHGSRDRKCGIYGPALVASFKEEIEARGLHGKVSVSPCSHVGGQKYAGNVIVFAKNIDGNVTRNWYGYVTPDDVPTLLEQQIGTGEILDPLWRGQMDLSEKEQNKSKEHRLPLYSDTETGTVLKESTQLLPDITGPQDDLVACCHANGTVSSCCTNLMPPEKSDQFDVSISNENSVAVMNETCKITCTRQPCGLPSWFESWENDDTFAALAVACAAASVVVAYGCYKQLN